MLDGPVVGCDSDGPVASLADPMLTEYITTGAGLVYGSLWR